MSGILGIDPGNDGSASFLDERGYLLWWLSFKDPDWENKLAQFLKDNPKCEILIEKVTSKRGNGIVSTWTFGNNHGAIRAVLKLAKRVPEDIDSKIWTQILGLPKRREIENAAKRRKVRRRDQEIWARFIFPDLRQWNPKDGDVFASALIALAGHARNKTIAERQHFAQVCNSVDMMIKGRRNDPKIYTLYFK